MTLAEIITAARDRSPAFHRTRVPNAVIARYLTGYQRRLISRACELNAEAFAQHASVMFAASPENAVGTVGAGTSGGLPASDSNGTPVQLEQPAGTAVGLDLENADVLVAAGPVGAVTSTTLTRTGAAWTTNFYANRYAWITDGPGINQVRLILSNTADTLTISTGSDDQEWNPLPTVGESLFAIVDADLEVDPVRGVVTALPTVSTDVGYLVRLNAAGVPYVDLTRPLFAQYDVGIDLPPHELILGGTIRFNVGDVLELELRRYGQRWSLGATGYGATVMGGKLFLIGGRYEWQNVVSMDLRYVPIAPALTALTDYLLLPETAYDVVVARSAYQMGLRVQGWEDSPKLDMTALASECEQAEGVFLAGIDRTVRRYAKYIREVW